MKIKFTYLSLEEPYTGKTGVVYNKFNALIDAGKGARLVAVACDAALAAKLARAKSGTEYDGEFDIAPSYGRKEPVLVLSSF